MKKLIAIVLVMVLVLSLTGCSVEAKLYKKYAEIITLLEEKNYTTVMNIVAGMAAEEQAANSDTAPAAEVLVNEWNVIPYNSSHADSPEGITFNEDNTCTVNGQSLSWLSTGASEYGEFLEGAIFSGEESLYYFFLYNDEDRALPQLELYTCTVNEGGYSPNEYMAQYTTSAMVADMVGYWYSLYHDEEIHGDNVPYSFSIGTSGISGGDYSYSYTITEETDSTLILQADAKEGYTKQLTISMELRDGIPFATVTDGDSGIQGYYYLNSYGYGENWPEYRYVKAVGYLDELLRDVENGYTPEIYVNDEWVKGNAAWDHVYQMFVDLGDYMDSAEIAGNFTILEDTYTKSVITYTDNLGNTSSDTWESLAYDAQGRLAKAYTKELYRIYAAGSNWERLQFTYGEDGLVSQIQYGNVTAIITPTYDAAGNMVSATAQYNTYAIEHTYTYDDAGRMLTHEYESRYDGIQRYTYTYDASGKLTQMVWVDDYGDEYDYNTYTTDYAYDSNGNLISETRVRVYWSRWDGEVTRETRVITYTNDDQGRPVTAEITTDDSSSSYAKQEIAYTYEDVYFYNAEG